MLLVYVFVFFLLLVKLKLSLCIVYNLWNILNVKKVDKKLIIFILNGYHFIRVVIACYNIKLKINIKFL